MGRRRRKYKASFSGVLNEYVNVLKNKGEIEKDYTLGKFSIVKCNNGIKLLYEKHEGNKIVIGEIDLTLHDVEALWILTVQFLGHYGSRDTLPFP